MRKNTKQLFLSFVLVPTFILTLAVLTQPQHIRQFAQSLSSTPPPPTYGCLQVGEGTNKNCASLQVKAEFSLTLHGRPLANKTIWYGDTVTGQMKYTNIGDVPINIQKASLTGGPIDSKYRVDFKPAQQAVTLNPGQTITLPTASHRFGHPDPEGTWKITAKLTDSNGQSVEDIQTVKVAVNTTCTVLRIKDLTSRDTRNLTEHCAKYPYTKLCRSQQYCEVVGDGKCDKAIPDEHKPSHQCDPWIIVSVAQQELFEEFCNFYPNTDACKDYCYQTLGSPICVEEVTIRVANNLRHANRSVAGIQTTSPGPEEQVAQDNAPGACVNGGAGFASCGTGTAAQRSTTGSTAPGAKSVALPKISATAKAGATTSSKTSSPAKSNPVSKAISAIVAPLVPVYKTILQAFAPPFTRGTCSVHNLTDCCRIGGTVVGGLCSAGTAVATNVSIKPNATVAAKHTDPKNAGGILCKTLNIGCPPPPPAYVYRGGLKIYRECPGTWTRSALGECINSSKLAVPGVRVAPPGTDIEHLPLTGQVDPQCGEYSEEEAPGRCFTCKSGYKFNYFGGCEPIASPQQGYATAQIGTTVPQKGGTCPDGTHLLMGGKCGPDIPLNQRFASSTKNTTEDPQKTDTPSSTDPAPVVLDLPNVQTKTKTTTVTQKSGSQGKTINEPTGKNQNDNPPETNDTPQQTEEPHTIPDNPVPPEQEQKCFSNPQGRTCGACVQNNKNLCCVYTGPLQNGTCPSQPGGCDTDVDCQQYLPQGANVKSTCDKVSHSCLTPQGKQKAQ